MLTDLRFVCDVQNSVLLRFCYKTVQAAVVQNHENINVRNIGQGEARRIESTKGSNLAAVRHTTYQMFTLLLYPWAVYGR